MMQEVAMRHVYDLTAVETIWRPDEYVVYMHTRNYTFALTTVRSTVRW